MSRINDKFDIKRAVEAVILALLTVTMMVICFGDENGNRIIYALLAVGLMTVALAAICVDKQKFGSVRKWALVIYVCLYIGVILYYITVKFDFVEKLKDLDNIKQIILSSGNFGIVCFFLLTVAQVLFLPIPTVLTVAAGSLIYGPVVSFLVSASATFLGSIICFILGRKLGKKLLYWLFDRKKVDKYADILGKKGKVPFIIMMVLPFFPDDMICIIAGMTDMSFAFYAGSVAIARSLYIFVVSFLGTGKIIPFGGWGIPVWILIGVVVIALSLLAGKLIEGKQKQ